MRARGRARPAGGGRRARFRGAAAAVALVAAAAAAGAAARGVLVLLAGEARGAGGHQRESRGLLADAAGGAETFPFAWTALLGGTASRRPLPRADLFVTPFGDASARALEKASDPSAATPFQVKSVTVARVGPSVGAAQNATAREHAAAVVARAAQVRAFDTAQRARRVRMVREIFALAGTVETSIAGNLSSGRTAASWHGMARRDSSSADRIRGMSRGAMRSANAHTDVVRADYGWIDLTPATLSSSVAELNQLAATARLAQRTIVDDKRNGPAQLLYSGGDKRFNAFHANIPQMTFAVAERGNASSVARALAGGPGALRTIATAIQSRPLNCATQNLTLPASSSYQQARVAAIETCAWADDLVSNEFVTGFRWEKDLWSWVPRAFAHAARTAAKLRKRTAPATSPFPNDEGEPESLRHGDAKASIDVRSDAVHGQEILADDVGTLDPTTGLRWPQGLACGGPAFLDVGTNIGDWLAPLRAALPPQVPIFGVEGLASNAAVAAANVLAAGLAKEMALIAAADAASSNATGHASSTGPVRTPPATSVGITKLLPFAMSSPAGVQVIRKDDGVCFSTETENNLGGQGMFGPRNGKAMTARDRCPPKALAGVTTLANALRGAACAEGGDGGHTTRVPQSEWPNVLVAKFDVEDSEFLALSSATAWLAEQPPCWVILETGDRPTSFAVLQLLWTHGYTQIWRGQPSWRPPREFPFTAGAKPFVDTSSVADMLGAVKTDLTRVEYKDYIIGRPDYEECVSRAFALR